MKSFLSKLALCAVAAPLLASAATHNKRYTTEKDGITYNVFEHAKTGSKLEFVENSGICETTPGVNQYSGYLSVGENMNMFFWFIEARNEPATAPLVSWFNGGPGGSSLNAMFRSNGPCQFYNGSDTPDLNPYSWNEYANMIYIDQPIGVGFSYGSPCCDSTDEAAVYVWNLIQAFYDNFPEYESRDFAIFAQSYGGRYGPLFANHIIEQNAAVANGTVEGEHVNLVTLAMNDGLYNMTEWYIGMIEFSYSNEYQQLIDDALRDELYDYYHTQCVPALEQCWRTDDDDDCFSADSRCKNMLSNIQQNSLAPFEDYDVRPNATLPPNTFSDYLQKKEIQEAVGGRKIYEPLSYDVYNNLTQAGDWVRPSAALIPSVLEAGVNVLMWTGDADWICSWEANSREADAVVWHGQEEFKGKSLEPYTVDGKDRATYKTVENFTYMRVFGAGHDMSWYQPDLTLQVLSQIVSGGGLKST